MTDSQEDRLLKVLKNNRSNYTINSKGAITLKQDYAKKQFRNVLDKLKTVKVCNY